MPFCRKPANHPRVGRTSSTISRSSSSRRRPGASPSSASATPSSRPRIPNWPKVVELVAGAPRAQQGPPRRRPPDPGARAHRGHPGPRRRARPDPRTARAVLGRRPSAARGRPRTTIRPSGSTPSRRSPTPRCVVKDLRDSLPGQLPRARAAPGARRGDRAGPARRRGPPTPSTTKPLEPDPRADRAPRSPATGRCRRRCARRTTTSLAIQALIAERVGAVAGPRPQAAGAVARVACSRPATRRSASGRGRGAPQDGRTESGDGARPVGARARSAAASEAVRMLELVCSYLERHEPSNPAPLFIRRAQRLMTEELRRDREGSDARQPLEAREAGRRAGDK